MQNKDLFIVFADLLAYYELQSRNCCYRENETVRYTLRSGVSLFQHFKLYHWNEHVRSVFLCPLMGVTVT